MSLRGRLRPWQSVLHALPMGKGLGRVKTLPYKEQHPLFAPSSEGAKGAFVEDFVGFSLSKPVTLGRY